MLKYGGSFDTMDLMSTDRLNRVDKLARLVDMDKQVDGSLPREKIEFINRYNRWLSSLADGDHVTIRQSFMGMTRREVGIIHKVTSSRFLVIVVKPNGLRSMFEFFRLRPLSDGFPRRDEMLLEPAIQPLPEATIADELEKLMGNE
jgi:hypothetical protein